MSIYWDWLDLQQIELARLHESAKTLIENVRAIGFSTQSRKPLGYKTGMQTTQPADCHTVEVVNGSGRDHDLHRHSAIHLFLHIGSNKRQSLFEPRVALAGRPDHVLEQFVRRLMRVSMEDDLPQHKAWTFGNDQTHALRRFDDVMHVHFRIAVFPIKNFKEKGEVVCARGIQSKILNRSDLFF